MTDADRPIVTARAYVEARLAAAGQTLESARFDAPVVVALDSFLARLREAGEIEEREHPFLRRIWDRYGAVFVKSRISAPLAAIQVAELAVLGATAIVHLGYAGGLDPALEIGDVVVTRGAVNETGTALLHGVAGLLEKLSVGTTSIPIAAGLILMVGVSIRLGRRPFGREAVDA